MGQSRMASAQRKCVLDAELLFLAVHGQGTDGRAGAGPTARVPDGGFEQSAELPRDEAPRAHVLRFLLAPDDRFGIRKLRDRTLELRFIERVELLETDE